MIIRKILGGACLLFLIGLVSFIIYIISDSENRLNISLDAVLGGGGGYLVMDKYVDSHFKDVGGEWKVLVKSNETIKKNIWTKYVTADKSDLIYYKSVFKGRFPVKNLDGYVLYKGGFTLGKGSICEKYECGIYILHSEENKNVYIGIYE